MSLYHALKPYWGQELSAGQQWRQALLVTRDLTYAGTHICSHWQTCNTPCSCMPSHAFPFPGCRTLKSCDVRLSQMNEDDEVAISEVFKQRTLRDARRH